MGALVWVAEQLDLIKLIDQACGLKGSVNGPTIGEMVLAVAVQRACAPAGKTHLEAFLESCVARVSCLPAAAFTGQEFHRLAGQVSDGCTSDLGENHAAALSDRRSQKSS